MSARTLAITRILSRRCNFCGALPGSACTSASGRFTRMPHKLRYYAALRDGLLPMDLQDALGWWAL